MRLRDPSTGARFMITTHHHCDTFIFIANVLSWTQQMSQKQGMWADSDRVPLGNHRYSCPAICATQTDYCSDFCTLRRLIHDERNRPKANSRIDCSLGVFFLGNIR